MHHDRRELAEERFRALLLKWLATLPPDGWEGTSHQLGDELAAFDERHRLYAFVPTCPTRKVAALSGLLSDNGFTLSRHRPTAEVHRAGRDSGVRRDGRELAPPARCPT